MVFTIRRNQVHGAAHQSTHIRFCKSKRCQHRIEDFPQNPVIRMRHLSVRPGKPGRRICIAGSHHTADAAFHLRADPLTERIVKRTAPGRQNPAFDIPKGDLLRRPSAGHKPCPGKSDLLRGHFIAGSGKSIQKRQFIGNVVVIGIGLPQILVYFAECFIKIL